MEALVDLSWRIYPAGVIAALGAALTQRGANRLWDSIRRPRTAAGTDMIYLRGFRLTIWGLTLLGLAAAWIWHLGWLLVLALVICGEETLECSLAISALRQRQRLEVSQPLARGSQTVRR